MVMHYLNRMGGGGNQAQEPGLIGPRYNSVLSGGEHFSDGSPYFRL